jgi:hypothetical protein
MNPFYVLSIQLTEYDPKKHMFTLSYDVATTNGINPDCGIRFIEVIGLTKRIMFEQVLGQQYLYIARGTETYLLEIVKE